MLDRQFSALLDRWRMPRVDAVTQPGVDGRALMQVDQMAPRLGVEHRHPQSHIRMAGVGDGLPGRKKLGMNDVE